jgi:hypothetical protein
MFPTFLPCPTPAQTPPLCLKSYPPAYYLSSNIIAYLANKEKIQQIHKKNKIN